MRISILIENSSQRNQHKKKTNIKQKTEKALEK